MPDDVKPVQIDMAFDPYGIFRDYFIQFAKVEHITYQPPKPYVCEKTIYPKGVIVDSIWYCHDSIEIYTGRITLFMGSKKQEITEYYGFINDWTISGKLCKGNPIEFGNFNHDDYLDFRIYDNSSGTMGSMYYVYLYNSINQIFEANLELGGPSLTYDSVHDVYQIWSKGGGCTFSAQQFKLKNGKKSILKTIEVEPVFITGPDKVVERKLIIGRDTFVKYYDYEDLDNYCPNITKIDKYCKDFDRFRIKHRLN